MALSLSVIFCFMSMVIIISEGVTIELVHRNSPHSPYYNASATVEDLSIRVVRNSLARFRYYAESKIQSVVMSGGTDYLMKLAIGTPPLQQIYAEMDTGSDLIWIQCHPCVRCYPQLSPIFYPFHSSTYRNLGCASRPCHSLPISHCGGRNNECLYQYRYVDNSSTSGELARDTFIFNSSMLDQPPSHFSNIIFGCGNNNSGTFESQSSGLVGLGRGALSLISQLRINKFTYCFVPPNSTQNSKVKIGVEADITYVASTGSIVSTPLLSNPSLYYLNLEGITVGSTRLRNNNTMAGGNTIIDSGTTLTVLKQPLYSDVENAVREMVGLNSVLHPDGVYGLCYEMTESLRRTRQVTMIFHFAGADVTLNFVNLFRDGGHGLTCLAMEPFDYNMGINIYGNQAQVNFQVQYDLARSRVSFLPTDCANWV